jgi:glycosyltransferase involved in cell wall biosynthesis
VRVVMVSKAMVVGAYQRKLEALACLPGMDLTLIVPPAWRDRRGTSVLERVYTTGYEVRVAPLAFNGQYHLHFYPTLGRLLRELRPQVLHVDEEPYNLATWQALRLGRALGARGLFFTWQNLLRRYPLPFAYFEKANYSLAAHAIAGSQAAAQVLQSKGYAGPLAIIPQFGVDPELFSPASTREAFEEQPSSFQPGPSSPFVIGYAGALIPEKGVDLLLQACASLPTCNWRLKILGDGSERLALANLAHALGIAGQMELLGRVSSIEAATYYRQFDVLVLPSRSQANWMEQFGRVLIEAMACGVPVIGSSSGEIPQVIGDAGIVFAEGDPQALCGALAGLAADAGMRAELAARGRARVLERFTQAAVATDTHRVYQAMMEGA